MPAESEAEEIFQLIIGQQSSRASLEKRRKPQQVDVHKSHTTRFYKALTSGCVDVNEHAESMR
jgi:hypothetical protein